MKNMKNNYQTLKTPICEMSNLNITTVEGRILFKDLNMSFVNERVALIGRNGVGKSTLLRVISGNIEPDSGKIIMDSEPYFVPQSLNRDPDSEDVNTTICWYKKTKISQQVLANEFAAAGLRRLSELLHEKTLSHGELRKLKLLIGKLTRPELLLLDEPTEDLDDYGISWLKTWLKNWPGGLLVASHEPLLLEDFNHFFVVSEAGSSYFSGAYASLEKELEKEYYLEQTRYVRNLNRLIEQEEHTAYIARRRRRKKQYGRISELGRASPRMRLNQKRDYAQVKHGRMKKIRDERLDNLREWTKSSRRALKVNLDLVLPEPELPKGSDRAIVKLEGVSAVIKGRCLFKNLYLDQRRERLAVVGLNGVGKTTLLEIMLRKRNATSGSVTTEFSRIGAIAQGGTDWMIEESLLSHLCLYCSKKTPEDLAKLLISHKFPLALGQRPIRSLSPGERVRAALICLFQRSPAVELLILDEPTFSLDFIGKISLTKALNNWPGGLVVASHNLGFLSDIGIEKYLELG